MYYVNAYGDVMDDFITIQYFLKIALLYIINVIMMCSNMILFFSKHKFHLFSYNLGYKRG